MKTIKILIILLTALPLFSAEKEELTLYRTIQKCLKNNFQIKIAEQNTKISENNNTWGKAGRYPSLSIGLDSSNSYNNYPLMNNPDERSKYSTLSLVPSVNLSWKLFSGFAIPVTKAKLGLLNQLSKGNGTLVVENSVHAALLGFYKVLVEQEKLKVTEKMYRLSKDRYDKAKVKQELGTAVTYDVLQAKIAYLDDKSNLRTQKMNLNSAKRELNILIGEKEEKAYIFSGQLKPNTEKYVFEELFKSMMKSNTNLNNQYINSEIMKRNTSLAKSSLFPTLSLNTGIRSTMTRQKYTGLPSSDSTSYNYYANFSVNMILFNGGNIKREIANAKLNEKIALLTAKELEFKMQKELRNNLELYRLKKDLYKISEERLKSAELNLRISEEKFRSGSINSFNYREVQITYLNSELSRLYSILDLISVNSDILRLTGKLVTEYSTDKN